MIKNKLIQRITALSLAFLMLLVNIPAAAAEYLFHIPNEFSSELPISEHLSLHQGTFWNESTINRINYFEYVPNSDIVPICAYGTKLYGRSTISEVSDYLQNNGYSVLGGVNGDFYTLATGLPSGIVIRNSELISSDGWQYGIGFRTDGSAFIGKPELKITAKISSINIDITGVNKLRTNVGVYLLTDDFSSSTRTSSPGTNIILSASNDSLGIGNTTVATVESIAYDQGAIDIPSGKLVLTADNSVSNLLAGINVGDSVSISIEASESQWNTADFAIGGGVLLLKDGEIAEQKNAAVNPRTAVGIKKDGTCIFYTVDGRQGGYSSGMSLVQLAEELKALGCVDAINMDGGGSTTAGIRYPNEEAISVINRPSDGTLRKNANFILFVTKSSNEKTVKNLYLKAENQLALPGTTLNFEVFGLNSSYNTAEFNYEPTAYADPDLGIVTESGVVKLNDNAVSGNICATYGNIYTKTPITVLNTFDTMNLTYDGREISAINLTSGDELDLDIAVSYKGQAIASSDNIFSWSLSNELIGEIDENGVFTAWNNGSFGQLTVTAINGMSKTIPITVGRAPEIIEDFENSDNIEFKTNTIYNELRNTENAEAEDTTENASDNLTDTDIEQNIDTPDNKIDLENNVPSSYSAVENNQQFVKYGNKSLKAAYDFADLIFDTSTEDTMQLVFRTPISAKSANVFDLWVYGDSSANSISLSAVTNDGKTLESSGAYSIDFEGWQCLRFEFDGDIARIDRINIMQNVIYSEPTHGTLYFDNLTAIYDDNSPEDTAAPIIQLNYKIKNYDGFNQAYDLSRPDAYIISGDVLIIYGNISDDSGANVLGKNVSASLDENAYALGFSENDGSFFSELDTSKLAPGMHKISVTAKDTSVNISRNTISFLLHGNGDIDLFFIDIDNHWSRNFAKYLADNAILTGETTPDGFAFRPDRPATRLETAVIMSRYLQLDLESYADVELPFSDVNSIPSWALGYVKAVYADGIMLGKQSANGVRFAGSEYITRAEAITLFGRTLEQGFEDKDCVFSDSRSIPLWAMPYVRKLYSLGVINGYSSDNTIRPQNTITRAEIASILFKL